jgi:hypothetical protein
MKKDTYLREFIYMRANGETYERITEETGVSKQTLIKWNKQHADEIKEMKKQLTEEYIKFIIDKRGNEIRHLFNVICDVSTNDRADEKTKNRTHDRITNKLNKIFGIRIKSLSFSLTGTEELTLNGVEIECE